MTLPQLGNGCIDYFLENSMKVFTLCSYPPTNVVLGKFGFSTASPLICGNEIVQQDHYLTEAM